MATRQTINGKRWGQWRYNQENLTLEFIDRDRETDSNPYYVDLEQSASASDILDWILQLSQKGWTRPEDIGHLVEAFDELAGFSLQGKVIATTSPFDWKAHLLEG